MPQCGIAGKWKFAAVTKKRVFGGKNIFRGDTPFSGP